MPPTEAVVSALDSADVILANSLATITSTALVLRDRSSGGHMIVSLRRVSAVRLVKFTYPGLLVVASALFLLAAAAHFSKQGNGADSPLAALGVLFVFAFWMSRKASVCFRFGREHNESLTGSIRQAKAVVSAIRLAQNALDGEDSGG